METYKRKLTNPKWQRKKTEILIRDNFTCTECGNTELELHVHHEGYKGEPWEAPNQKLKTLCHECHEIVHGVNLSNADIAIKKLLEMKEAICKPLLDGVSPEKELQILTAAMKIDQSMIRIRRVNG